VAVPIANLPPVSVDSVCIPVMPLQAEDELPVEHVEVDLLLEGIYRTYGFDFRRYARASIRRRIWRRVEAEAAGTISGLQERLLHDRDCMDRFVADFSVRTTAMFRDARFFQALRTKVVPALRTYPFIRVWNAGCSTGEEAYSIAILLAEEGLYNRSRIYATDLNEAALERARTGRFPLGRMQDYTRNYIAAGGRRAFSEYFTVDRNEARFDPWLRSNLVFAQHDLVSDRSFNEFHLILCRNVLIYFDPTLQEHVQDLLYQSLGLLGILALGPRETLRSLRHEQCYEALDAGQKLYRRMR
jgi:chemotaxis protein methyltransferase CheR